MTVRTRTFLGIFLASTVALAVSTLLVERSLRAFQYDDIRNSLLNQARLTGHMLVLHDDAVESGTIDAEADEIGLLLDVRVTLIAADGRVLGESALDGEALREADNHGARLEVEAAARDGQGTAVRRSATTGIETMYAAVRIEGHPVRFIRLALPLTRVNERVSDLRQLALVGLGAGLLVALIATAVTSVLLNRRLRMIADTARRYVAGDFSRPARDHGRDELGMVANVLDTTARELGSRLGEMARERAHTDAILHGMVEGVLLVNRDGRLVLTNPAARSMLHLPDPAVDLHYIEVVRQPAIAAIMSAVLSGQPAAPVEIEMDLHPKRRMMASVVPVSPDRGGGAVLVLHDITELRHADQVRRDFVANVSHELRTPLTAIRGYVEALLDAPAEAQSRHFLEVISRHALRMERLVRDLLRLARLDAGQETAELVSCPVAAIVDSVQADLESLLERRRQQVERQVEADASTIMADPAKLQDVLRNLLENASNYSPEGSTIDVLARRLADGRIEISVADRGPGIPEHDLPRIFERFYRADRSRSRDPGGTGLGLSIVRHLVGLHGGTITAANRSGGGAVFTLTI